MVDLNRQIRATQARQGGFSAHVLPGQVGYQKADTFIFAPQRIGGQWQLTDGTPLLPWAIAPAAESSFQSLGGPGGRDAIRHFPYLWGGFQTEEDPKFSASSSVSGLTIDGWVLFAPVTASNTGSLTLQWGLTRAQTADYLENVGNSDVQPSIYIEVDWVPSPARVRMSMVYAPATGSRATSGVQLVLENTTSGWHHYAVEYAASGDYVLFFDGQPVKSGAIVAPDLSQMQVMHGSWVFAQQSQILIPPEYADMSYLRCQYRLPYQGQAFTP